LDGILENRIFENGITRRIKKSEIKHILLVDDSVNSGKSLLQAIEKSLPLKDRYRLTVLIVYGNNKKHQPQDITLENLPSRRVFEWNIFHHPVLNTMCVDIDGVLCKDPSTIENDDGEKYKDFLLNAEPLLIPTTEIGALVTSRLEKYRQETEHWLNKNNVRYKELYMLGVNSAKERREQKLHAKFKSRIYKKIWKSPLFIESDAGQAQEVAKLSGKPCLCFETQAIYYPDTKIQTAISQEKLLLSRIINKILKKSAQNQKILHNIRPHK
jgi:uncharacterized HAD superfamily protein